jgi:hypothetical protein
MIGGMRFRLLVGRLKLSDAIALERKQQPAGAAECRFDPEAAAAGRRRPRPAAFAEGWSADAILSRRRGRAEDPPKRPLLDRIQDGRGCRRTADDWGWTAMAKRHEYRLSGRYMTGGWCIAVRFASGGRLGACGSEHLDSQVRADSPPRGICARLLGRVHRDVSDLQPPTASPHGRCGGCGRFLLWNGRARAW